MITKLQKQSFNAEIRHKLRESVDRKSINGMKVLKTQRDFSAEEKAEIVIEGQLNDISRQEICSREGISISTFQDWKKELLSNDILDNNEMVNKKIRFHQKDRFKLVLEGKNGLTSIAELCRREGITQELFLDWSKEFIDVRRKKVVNLRENKSLFLKNKLLIGQNASDDVFTYLENYLDFTNSNNLIILKEDSLKFDAFKNIENVLVLEKINDIRYINKFFEKVNSKLEKGKVFIGCLETFSARKERKRINKIPIINNIYFGFEFIFKRILPKLSFTKKHYFDITKGTDRYLSKAEGLGRLVSCGFKIMDFKTIDNLLYFVVKKEKEPTFDMNPSYGPLYKMNRIGKNGKIIGVYKFRTMHPYSEYLQDFIVNANGYAETGKPADDFRIPAWGKFMRRIWLDELPQLINVLKGELKLVGVRPVSERYFQDIPKEMQKLRLTQKPGCIPPYVALNRDGNVMSVLQSEKDYLEEKIENPYTTDLKYFFKAIYNILIKHKRSA